MINNIYDSIKAGMAFGMLGVFIFLIFMCLRQQCYVKRKKWEIKLSLNGLEYTLREIYTLLKKYLCYPNYKMMEFDSENDQIRIICRDSVQLLSLKEGELILRGEGKGKSLEELIDTECLMIAIEEYFEFPVKISSKVLLKRRTLDKWALRGVVICFAIILLKFGVLDKMSLVKRVQEMYFTQYSSTVTVGEALEKSCVDTKWEEGTYDGNRSVRFSGYTYDMGVYVYVIFEVKKDTAEIVEIGIGNDSYNDNLTIHIFMTGMYNYNLGDSTSSKQETMESSFEKYGVTSNENGMMLEEDISSEASDEEKYDSNKEKIEDITEKYNLEDYYGSYLSMDGYVRVEINPVSSHITEIVLSDVESGTIDYTLTAAFVQDEDNYYLRASNSTQTIEIRKDYIEFDGYEGEGISISGCEIKTYNNLYIDETVAEAQQVGKSEYTNTADLSSYLGTLYSIYGGDVIIELYMDTDGNLCVMEGNPVTEYVSYSQTYDSYIIKDNTLYGYAEDFVDEFTFGGAGTVDGEVEVLLSGSGSTHYQTYIQEEEYFNTNWRGAFGME